MKQMEADVVVVAGGVAGLAAAITAAEKGASVIILEKANTTGGTGNMAMGIFGVESRLQAKMLVGLTPKQAFDKFMEYTHWQVDAKLVKEYVYKSGDTINWLEDMGVKFTIPSKYFPGSEATWHLVKPKTGDPGVRGAAIMMTIMTERAQELGVEICLETPVKEIIKEDGVVVGVIAENASGEEIEVRGGAVIVATGGFGDNPEMIKEGTGLVWGEDLFSYRIPGLAGEGINMACEAGAAQTPLTMEFCYFSPDTGGYAPLEIPFRQGDLLVNYNGDRFMNEEVMENPPFVCNAIKRQPKKLVWSIIDENIKNHYEKNGLDLTNVVTAYADFDLVNKEIDEALENRPDIMVCANSIEELAEKTGIDVDGLKKTLEEYNHACETRDELFEKNWKYLKPIKGPKYYACKFGLMAYGSLGGVRINHKAEAVDNESNPVPGLYAAGIDANSICGNDYIFILPGNSMGFAVNSGRIAGENAVEYIQENLA